MKEKKLQIAIYKINNKSDIFFETEPLSSLLILSNHIKSKGFSIQELRGDPVDNFTIKLLYAKKQSRPGWKGFLNSVSKDDQNILKEEQCWNEGFVMLLLNNITNNLYAVVGGFGYYAIQDFVDDNFGVDILSRLIKKEDRILKSVREKSVIGGILGTTKYFRKKYNLFENDSFGKIYQELKTDLSKDVLKKHFGFSADDLKTESACIAQSSFKINKSITFEQLLKIIGGCEYIMENPDNDTSLQPISINNVEKIIKKKEQKLVKALEEELFNQLWQRYSDDSSFIDFDLCHKDFEKYLTASKYIVRKNSSLSNFFKDFEFQDDTKLENIDKLFDKIKELENKPENRNDFEDLVRSLKIYSYNEEDESNEQTKGKIIQHLFGDVSLDDKKYFLIDDNWYMIKEDFIKELDVSCKNFIKDNFNNGLGREWDYPLDSENKYNKKYIGDDKTIVLDKIIPDNIEACDILKWDSQKLYLYHVKAGFGNTTRDLCSQIFIAANKIKSDINSSQKYIGEIYDQLQGRIGSKDDYSNKIGKQTERISREEFVKLFTSKKIVFVLSVLDTAKNERNLKTDIEKLKSNIAKFSLRELVKGMRGIEADFEIAQIKKIRN